MHHGKSLALKCYQKDPHWYLGFASVQMHKPSVVQNPYKLPRLCMRGEWIVAFF